jgi:hypothetical protein
MDEVMDWVRAGERADHYETRRRRKDGATIAVSLSNREQQAASWTVVTYSDDRVTVSDFGRFG